MEPDRPRPSKKQKVSAEFVSEGPLFPELETTDQAELKEHVLAVIKKLGDSDPEVEEKNFKQYALDVWKLRAFQRSFVDEARMSTFRRRWAWEDYRTGLVGYAPDVIQEHSGLDFIATIDAANVADHPPPGYVDFFWSEMQTHQSGPVGAMLRLLRRNTLLLSTPQLIMLMMHGMLHLYTESMILRLFADPLRGLPSGQINERLANDWIVLFRLRSNVLDLNPQTDPILTADVSKGGSLRQRYKIYHKKLGLSISHMPYSIPPFRQRIWFIFAEGGKRIAKTSTHMAPSKETPFLGVYWLHYAHRDRILQWYQWSKENQARRQ